MEAFFWNALDMGMRTSDRSSLPVVDCITEHHFARLLPRPPRLGSNVSITA